MKRDDNREYINILNEGIKFKRQEEYEKAKENYIRAIKADSENPTAYYNLGKILYILKDYGPSVRAYKVAYDLGYDPYNTLIHLGHALNDDKVKKGKWSSIIWFYRASIDPKFGLNKLYKVSKKQLNEYEAICIEKAKEYIKLCRE